jgi:non-specific serine/threonine protein kinase/serine/threonine-protein kinase
MNGRAPDIGIDEIYFAAVECEDPAARAAYLAEACGTDTELRRQVERLLEARAERGSFLEAPALGPTIEHGAGPIAEGPGTVIGPYKLREQIGEGGMGVVYVAEQHQPVRRKVALKIIKPGMDTKQVIARFEAERQALAMMEHPNIARVHDAGATDSGRPYFVMELVRDIPITEYCDRERLSISERLELFILVCRAVQHAHQKGIIHRDLKPSNILVTVIDGAAVPKIIDFGVAKATGGSLTERTIYTAFHQFVGTPLYMSPEQADLAGMDVDTRSDIYSLGVLLYELLTGTTPFDQATFRQAAFDELRRIIREHEPPKPSTRLSSLGATRATVSANRQADARQLDRAVRGELDWIVMKALEKDRRRRYETANDFAADVTRYLADKPVEACPPSAWYRFSKYARRNRAALTTATLVALALITGTLVSAWQAAVAVRARRETSRALTTARIEADKATAINEFLVNDLLKQADPENNAVADRVTLLEVLDRAADKVGARFHDKPLIEAALRDTIGETYMSLGAWEKGRQNNAAALAIYEREKGPGAAETANAMRELGYALFAVGRDKDAEPLLSQAVDRLRRIRGEEHADTAEALAKLGLMYVVQGKLSEAEPLLSKALEISRRVRGEEHPLTLNCMGALGKLFLSQGTQAQVAKAESLLGKVREIRRRVSGEENHQVSGARESLATMHATQDKDKLSKAEPQGIKDLEISRRVWGEEHPKTLGAMADLASAYEEQGKWRQAEALYAKALEVERRDWGEEHRLTLEAMSKLGIAYAKQGKLSEAEPLLVKALEGRRRVFGEEHRNTLMAMNNLAMLYQRQGKPSGAESLFIKAVEGFRRVRGEEHPDTLMAMDNLARFYRQQGKPSEAEPLFIKLLEARRRDLGEEHRDTLMVMNELAVVHQEQGKLSEAEPLLSKALEAQRRVLGEYNAGTLTTMNNLGFVYARQGKLSQAEPLLVKALEGLPGVLGEGHDTTLLCRKNLAHVYWLSRRFDRSIPLYADLLERTRAKLGPDHPGTLRNMADLGVNYRYAGRLPEATDLLEQAWARARKLPEPRVNDLAWIRTALAETYDQAGEFAKAGSLYGEILEMVRRQHQEASSDSAGLQAVLALISLKQQKYADAEPLLRECLKFREKNEPDDWKTFNAKSLLGASLLGQKRYDEAEPLLRTGYEGMKRREEAIPLQFKIRLAEAIERLVQLYEAWGQPEKAAAWKVRLGLADLPADVFARP